MLVTTKHLELPCDALLRTTEGLYVTVRVVDAKTVYGQRRLLVKGTMGEAWVDAGESVMTRKDYVLIAQAMRNAQPNRAEYIGPEGRAWLASVYSLSNALLRDNPRFNPDTFHSACGITDTPGPQPHCSNCGQWQHAPTWDCMNECARKGLAKYGDA